MSASNLRNTATTTALLEQLLDRDNGEAWVVFDQRYRGILLSVLRKMGLDPEDCADVAQETMLTFVRNYRDGRYDRKRGRLRSWILGIARNKCLNLGQRQRIRGEGRGHSVIDSMADPASMEQSWVVEAERSLLAKAFESLSRTTALAPVTIEAFRLCGLEGWEPTQVAEKLDLSLRAVYLAKHRCTGRLRELVGEMRLAYEFDE